MTEVKQGFETILCAVESGVGLISLNRPDRMNTVTPIMKRELETAFFEIFRQDENVRCVVLTGVGERAFCAGADIKQPAPKRGHAMEYFTRQKYTHDLYRAIETYERPVIGAINGVALGGGLEIALCCDIRIAASTARFGLPEVTLGVLPAAGGTQRLPRAIGESRAKELIFTGRKIDAAEALSMGLVSRVVEPADLMGQAMAVAKQIAAQPPLAVMAAKHVVNAGLQVGIEAGLHYERYGAAMIIDSEDRREGMRAFAEKRAAVFVGR